MSDLVERVGRAIFESLYGDTHTGGWVAFTADVNISENQKERFRKMARAAIAAVFDWLAEPGKSALDAGMTAAENALDTDYDSGADGEAVAYQTLRSDAPSGIYAAMLSTLRREALGEE